MAQQGAARPKNAERCPANPMAGYFVIVIMKEIKAEYSLYRSDFA